MRRIVIPTKSFEDTMFMFRYAKMWFGAENVEYLLLNCYKEPTKSTEMMMSLTEILAEESERYLQEQKKDIVEQFPDVASNVKTLSMYGFLEDCVLKLHQHRPIDFVVMATSGAGKIKRFFGGSITSKVVSHADVPVISIPYKYTHFTPPKAICLCIDYAHLPNADHLKTIALLSRSKKASISVVHINTGDSGKNNVYESETKSLIAQHLSNCDYKLYDIDADSIAEGIKQFVQIQDPSLVVMIAHKKNFFQRWFETSQSKLITNISEIPVLVLKES